MGNLAISPTAVRGQEWVKENDAKEAENAEAAKLAAAPLTDDSEWYVIRDRDAVKATEAMNAQLIAAKAEAKAKADAAAEQVKSVAPTLAIHAAAFIVFQYYLPVFALLSYANCNLLTFGFSAFVSTQSNKLAANMQNVNYAVEYVAGAATHKAVTTYQNYKAGPAERWLSGRTVKVAS